MSTYHSNQELMHLLKQCIVVHPDIKLSSGTDSTFYIDINLISLTLRGSNLIAQALTQYLPNQTQAVAGLEIGAIPLILAITYNTGIPSLVVRKRPKSHGLAGKSIEGPELEPGSNVVVIEDVVTTGASLSRAVNVLRLEGFKVTKALALIDRSNDYDLNKLQLRQRLGITYEALFSIHDLIPSAPVN